MFPSGTRHSIQGLLKINCGENMVLSIISARFCTLQNGQRRWAAYSLYVTKNICVAERKVESTQKNESIRIISYISACKTYQK